MSVINQMLRDLDKRGAAAPGTSPAGTAAAGGTTPPNASAHAFAAARMPAGRGRTRRTLLVAGGVAAMLPIAWAAAHFDGPVSAERAAAVPTQLAVPAPAATVAVAVEVPTPAQPPAEPDARSEPVEAAPSTHADTSERPGAELSARAEPGRYSLASTVPAHGPSLALPVLHDAQDLVRHPAAKLTPQRVNAAAQKSGVEEPTRATTPARVPDSAGKDTAGNYAAGKDIPSKDTRLALASPAVPKDEARIERRPTDARDDLTRAGEAMSIGRTSDAIVLLRKVIQAEPDNERARLALLSLLAERGRDDTWRNTLADSARALPHRFGLAAAQGMAESGRFDQSLAILQGLPDTVRDARYFSALGATHQRLNQHADAVAAFDAALKLAPGASPQLPSLLVAQAVSMQSLGKAADARRNLERVRQMPEAAADVRDFADRELAHTR